MPVRALAYAARLIRDARQLPQYGITDSEPVLHYERLLARVRAIVHDVDALGVTLHERGGAARFADSHTIETERGLRLQADRFIICTGGVSRRLAIPGFDLTNSHSDAWKLTEIPPSMLVIGTGHTGVQVASMFHAFGTRVELFEAGSRILRSETKTSRPRSRARCASPAWWCMSVSEPSRRSKGYLRVSG